MMNDKQALEVLCEYIKGTYNALTFDEALRCAVEALRKKVSRRLMKEERKTEEEIRKEYIKERREARQRHITINYYYKENCGWRVNVYDQINCGPEFVVGQYEDVSKPYNEGLFILRDLFENEKGDIDE